MIQRDQHGRFPGLEDGSRYTLTVQEDAASAAASAAAAKEVAARNKALREQQAKEASLSKSKVLTSLTSYQPQRSRPVLGLSRVRAVEG